jgi:hypothetical protein
MGGCHLLGARPLEAHDQNFFFQQNSCGNSPYVASSLTRRWVCLLWICMAFHQVYISHIWHVIENSSFCTAEKSSVSTGFTEQIMPNLWILPSQSQSHIVTDSQSVLVSSPMWGSWPNCRCSSILSKSKSKSHYDWRSVITRYLLLFDSYSLVIVGRPLWREDGTFFFQSHCLH